MDGMAELRGALPLEVAWDRGIDPDHGRAARASPAVDDVDYGDDVDCVDQSSVPGARSASANGFSPFMRGEIRGRLQAEGENAEGEKTTRHIERTERLWLFVHCLLR